VSDLDPLSAPKITLRGKTYKLPEMELKQVIPITSRLLQLGGSKFSELSEDKLTLLYDVMFLTLGFVDPDLTREDFERSPPSYPEMLKAWPIIMRSARFIERKDASAEEPTPGEAPAGSGTGTSS
jgi:hypothetical protein